MRRFEKVGLTRAQAEQVTELLTETICMNKVKITEQFVSKAALERVLPQLFWPALMACSVSCAKGCLHFPRTREAEFSCECILLTCEA